MGVDGKAVLYIVVPCYNEEQVLPETTKRLKEKLCELIQNGSVSPRSRIVYVDDGSSDNTWKMISQMHAQDKLISGLNLSRNRGHQNALLAGLLAVRDRADMVISMDADLQDDINAIDEMIKRYKQGYEVVYGVRSERKTDSFLKKITAQGFYKFINMLGAESIYNHADYRLMGKMALARLSEFNEVNLYLRGIIPMIGYKSCTVTYERSERFAGESKYPLKRMLAFAAEGITSLSIRPIRMITALGIGIFIVSIAMLIYVFIKFFAGETIIGWSSVVVSVWGIGGLTLLSVGVIGEYIGKIYLETKRRPRFIVDKFLNEDD